MLRKLLAAALMACGIVYSSSAQEEATEEQLQERLAAVKKVVDSLKYQEGEILLRDGLAKVSVPAEFRYLDPADADTVLTKIWGNPPSEEKTLGMLIPADASPLDPKCWGVILTYEEDGYVKDDEAASINYADLLKQMQESTKESNEARKQSGYPGISLVGWAAQPRYDKDTHKLYWAKELAFEDSEENTLNYNLRILGRRGVLVLNAVAGMSQLAEIEAATPKILSMVDFQEGHRYADFNPATDKVASYGLAALVAGGVLAKGGFFKVILGTLMAFKKFLIIGVIALAAGLKFIIGRFFGRKEATAESPVS